MTEHLPECPVEKMLRSGRTVGSQSCICEHLRACEERIYSRDIFMDAWKKGHANGLGEAEAALRQLETDMRNWSSDETRAATDAVPDLTAGSWLWAQHGVGRSIQVIGTLKEKQ